MTKSRAKPRRARVALCWREHGVHIIKKTCDITVPSFGFITNPDEDLLLELLKAAEFELPQPPKKILLLGRDQAIAKPRLFRPWGKYFSCYALHVDDLGRKSEEVSDEV